MAFIRTKKINGKPYAYLVESVSTPQGPRQKVKKYLGRVHSFDEVGGNCFKADNIVHNLIVSELGKYGFEYNKGSYVNGKVVFNPKTNKVVKGKKDAVVKVGEGHLSSFTVKRLINFKKSNDVNKDATLLAKYFLEAGLNVSQEEFIEYYSNL